MAPEKLAVRLAVASASVAVAPDSRAARTATNALRVCWVPGVMPTSTNLAPELMCSNGA
jgi:hypothetical protein